MPERLEQSDFFAKLKPASEEINEGQIVEKVATTPKLAKKKFKKIPQDFNIPAGGKLGGWQSYCDGNQNDPKLDKRWRR